MLEAGQCATVTPRAASSSISVGSGYTVCAMTERGPKAKLIEFPGIGHAPALMADDQIAVVRDWLLETEFPGAAQAWFIMTCGSEIGHAGRYNRSLCQAKDLTDMGTAQIIMPENYIAMFDAPQAEEARRIVAKAQPDIDRSIAAVREGRPFPPPHDRLYDRFMSGPVNPIFYACFVKSSVFTVSEACTGCGQCVRRCPTNSITLRDARPVWGKGCTHCMACICYCPTSAIEYGKKSLGKPRYHFEAL